jgi:hypothetical protein
LGGRVMVKTLSVEIKAEPEAVYNYIADYSGHFKEVSPDHLERVIVIKSIRIKDGYIDNPRVYWYFKQISPVTGKVQKLRARLLRLEPNRRICYKFLFPYSFVLPRVENTLDRKGDVTVYTTNLTIGRLFAWLAGRSKKVAGVIDLMVDHIQEEMDNTRKVVEGL